MDFFSRYLNYTEDTESPRIYHRWCAITAIGAMLGRNLYLRHGHLRIYPNTYCMLLGNPAARKSTAIKLSQRLLSEAGYNYFASDKNSKEKFLIELAGNIAGATLLGNSSTRKSKYDSATDINLWGSGDETTSTPKEVLIAADEFNDFAGVGQIEFYTTLGSLWDWDKKESYKPSFKSYTLDIFQPTISILGGNTQEGFARAFPPEMIGHGFLSRMLLIHGHRTDKKIAFPTVPTEEATTHLVSYLARIRSEFVGSAELVMTVDARSMLEVIYVEWLEKHEIKDIRFEGYNNRRFTHLLKLCVLVAGSRLTRVLTPEIVVAANTMLSAAELLMPDALGEFGKSKNSDVSNKIISILEKSNKPIQVMDIWSQVHKDLNKVADLGEIIQGLQHAGRVQYIKDKGFLPKKEVKTVPKFVDWSLLTEEERAVK